MRSRLRALTATLMLLCLAGSARAATISHGVTSLNMDFVTVGNPGNDADVGGYGSIDHTYQIGKYEVSQAQWDAVSGASDSDLLDDPGSWSGNQPVAAIAWHEAAMFCNWLTSGDVTEGVYTISLDGKVTGIDRANAQTAYETIYFLPTEDEWYKAAYYDPDSRDYFTYPTSSDSDPDGIDYLGDPDFDAVFWDLYNQSAPNAVTATGLESPYGTMGQGGNVWEWTETAIGSSLCLRGGSYDGSIGTLESSIRYEREADTEHVNLGFRVASSTAVPEPSSLILWAGGGFLTLALRRRRRRNPLPFSETGIES